MNKKMFLPDDVRDKLLKAAANAQLDVSGGGVRRSSSRFCFGVEHGDYNGTELFGIGTDRFIWLAYKANDLGRARLFSVNVPGEGVVDIDLAQVQQDVGELSDQWGRFPVGAAHILKRVGVSIDRGFDAVLFGNIPGGGMSRSASLTLNLLLTMLDVNGVDLSEFEANDPFRVTDLAQAVENDFIGSPCGNLDQIMIYFAKAGRGTHYSPADRSINYVSCGADPDSFRIVSLDTGTDRPGLDKSTYKVRRTECERLVELAADEFQLRYLADVNTPDQFGAIKKRFCREHPLLVQRLRYIYDAQQRFPQMLAAWEQGDVDELGRIFRADGLGLRDDYQISGPELEAMCDIARTVSGVLGERMLGGGDKGASGAIVEAGAVSQLRAVVTSQYPQRYPQLADKFAVHECKMADGIVVGPGI